MSMRISGLIIIIAGLIVTIVGFRMYRSPPLNWESFIVSLSDAFSSLAFQISYLIENPLGIIGFIVILAGVAVSFKGLKMLIFG